MEWLDRILHIKYNKIGYRMMSLSFIFLVIYFYPLASLATVYKWTDNKGVVHFSDQPAPGAQVVPLQDNGSTTKSIQSHPPSQPQSLPNPAMIPANKPIVAARKAYESIEIIQPKNEETIRNNAGYVLVEVKVTPELQKGDAIQVLYDGKPFGDPQNKLVIALNNVFRGQHTVAVQVLDKKGNILIKSTPTTIFMHRPTVNMIQKAR